MVAWGLVIVLGLTLFTIGHYVLATQLSTIVEVSVDASSDDAEEIPSGDISLTDPHLELVTNPQHQIVGIRFSSLDIPPQAIISQAYIQFQAAQVNNEATTLTISAQASGNASTFTSARYDISNRPTTMAAATWSPPPWTTIGAAGPEQQTADLSAVIQEVIDRPDWTFGNALAFIITGDGQRVAEAFDGLTAGAPLLHVEYSGGTPPTATPTPTPVVPMPTPFPPGSTIQFAVIGDYGSESSGEAAVAALVTSWEPDFVITVGDNNYPDGEASTIDINVGQYYSSFIGNYQGTYGSGSPINRFWPTLGNHDWRSITCNGNDCTGPYFDYFTLPGNERYYSLDFGPISLFALNSEYREPDGNRADQAQALWLQTALPASTSCFNLVYFHHSPYSTSLHGNIADMQWPFADWGADTVIAGHDHVYERLDVNGIPYFVNGLGGRSFYTFPNIGNLPPDVTSVVRYNADFGAMLITVTDTIMVFQFFNTSATLIDEYLIEDENCLVPPTPTSTPTTTSTPNQRPTLTATPTIINSPVSPTITATVTATATGTWVTTPTQTPTPLPSPIVAPFIYMPLINGEDS